MSLQSITELCNHPVIAIVGGISFCLTALSIIAVVIGWALGITPPLIRLGLGLWRRKIAIISSADNFRGLNDCLVDSKLFRACNITNIGTDNLEKGKKFNLLLIDWSSTKDYIEQIVNVRENDQTPLIIYANPADEPIPRAVMTDIANRQNTVVVNFRGRLINDIVTSLITTS
jgi:hypothetical protein